jgi:hypothetical protein
MSAAELQDPLHRLGDGLPLALRETTEAGDDPFGVLQLEAAGQPGELVEGALALPLLDRRL